MLINSNNDNHNFIKYHRHSLRIKNYNYSLPGAYFVTICTYHKENILGYIIDGKIELDVLGKITVREWLKTFQIRKNIQLDEYVIMPNHFHGIIILTDDSKGVLHTPKENFPNNPGRIIWSPSPLPCAVISSTTQGRPSPSRARG